MFACTPFLVQIYSRVQIVVVNTDTFLLSLSLPSTCCQHHMREENHSWANSPSRARFFLSLTPHFSPYVTPHSSYISPPFL